MAAFFLFGLGIGRKEGKDEAIEERYDFSFRDSSYRLAASSSVLMMPFGRPNYRTNQCQITENSRNKSILPNDFTPNYRKNSSQITEN